LRKQLGIGTETIVFLYSGTLRPERRIDILIQSFSKMIKDVNNVCLLIAGDDRDNPQTIENLKKLVGGFGLQNSVFFTGFVQYDKLVEYYHIADIGLCYIPQTPYYNEQPPTKLFEYMAAGLVVVGTKTSAIQEIIKHGVNGYLANDNAEDFSECLHSVVLQDTKRRLEIINNGYKSIERYSWDYIIDNYIRKYYEELNIRWPDRVALKD
jgi:glycosyltransferase involved in cell wall biosynthesis